MRKQLFVAVTMIALILFAANPMAQPVQQPSVLAAAPSEVHALSQEIERLKSTIADQQKQISQQQGMLHAITQKSEGTNTGLLTAVGIIIAALIAGYFALTNQNNQAAQGRLLKAVELIMESRSGYQADIRRQNLSVFLDAATKKHLEKIKDTFSGPEFTDLHVQLAEAMASKAQSPQEVLDVWKSVLKEKNIFNRVEYANRT